MKGVVSRAGQYVAGTVLLVLLWQVIGKYNYFGPAWPPLSQVVDDLTGSGREAILSGLRATASSAGEGLIIGVGAALTIAFLHQIVRLTRPGLDRASAALHAIPAIGIAPVLVLVLGRTSAPAAVAAVGTIFPVYVTVTAALDSVQAAHSDLFRVLGGGSWQRLQRLQLPTVAPGLLDALRLAAPAAVLGAVLGEWFGAPRGLGIIILSSSQNYQIVQMWAAALATTLLSLVAFAAASVLQIAAKRRFT
jgi:NitT/TauT family transport system permease protein